MSAMSSTCGDAMLALSGGNLGRLGYYLAAAQHKYQDVLY